MPNTMASTPTPSTFDVDIEMPVDDTLGKSLESIADTSNTSCSTARPSLNFRRSIALGVDQLKRTVCNAYIDADSSDN